MGAHDRCEDEKRGDLMQTGTIAVEPDSVGNNQCGSNPQNKNKQNTQTLLELAKAKGWGTGGCDHNADHACHTSIDLCAYMPP